MHRLIFYIFLTLVFLTACSQSTAPENYNTAQCVYVYDGDTYQCILDSDTIVVRHLYIDCYEIHRGSRLEKQAERNHISVDSALSLGLQAKEYVKKLIQGKNIKLIRINGEDNMDVYGRYLRLVVYQGNRLDSLLLNTGLAFEYKPFILQ